MAATGFSYGLDPANMVIQVGGLVAGFCLLLLESTATAMNPSCTLSQ